MIIDETNIDSVLSAHLGYKKYLRISYDLIDAVGLEPAALLSELWWLYTYFLEKEQLREDGFFYRNRETLEKRTGLSSYKQRKHSEMLVEKGLIAYKTERLASGGEQGLYQINKKNLLAIFCHSDLSHSRDDILEFPRKES